jgi:hypothetical protein
MELYTKTNLKRVAVAFGLILIMPVSSCKKLDEDKINTDTKKLEHGPYVAGSYITGMMQNIIRSCPTDIAQLQQSLNADVYSGYMASATPFAGGTNNLTYHMMDGWNNQIAQVPYSFVLNPWLQVKKETMETEKELYAISLIIKVTAAHRLTDVFGPIPYTQLGTSVAPAFDSQETIYNTFFTELRTAVDILTAAEDKDPDLDRIKLAPYDVSSLGGDFKLWVQYANTLRLRLAIRIANVKPGLAQTEGQDAVNHKYGPLQIPFSIATSCATNYVSQISNVWHDISLNADMESYLTGYKDPRAAKYAHPATAPSTVVGQTKGIRNGIVVAGKNYVGYSSLNIATEDKQLIMTAAEGYFLRAEGKLRNWVFTGTNDNTPQAFYDLGIAKSFEQYSLAGAADYSISKATPADYVDDLDNGLNIGKASTVTVDWNDGAVDFETKLEKIITQKWIAMFPEGQEAWSEFRRTGYPKLFPVVKNDSDGDLLTGQFIKRIPYPSYFTSSNPAGTAAAVNNYLGGKDKMSTKLWWDNK